MNKKIWLFPLLVVGLFASCSESDDVQDEYRDWKGRNEAFSMKSINMLIQLFRQEAEIGRLSEIGRSWNNSEVRRIITSLSMSWIVTSRHSSQSIQILW